MLKKGSCNPPNVLGAFGEAGVKFDILKTKITIVFQGSIFDSYMISVYIYMFIEVENPSNIPFNCDEVLIKASEVSVGVASLRIVRNTVHNPIGSMYICLHTFG